MSTPTNKSFQTHASFAELVDCFDGFILDQFGVIRDSDYALEGAPECVTELVKSGKKLVILSNSSSLSSATVERLPKFGFDPENFVGAVTSGQEACHYIKDKFQGKKALFITWKSGNVSSAMEFMESCGNVEVTDVVEEADFILLHGAEVLRGPGVVGEAVEQSLGSFSETGELSVIDPILQNCTTQKLPMFVVIQTLSWSSQMEHELTCQVRFATFQSLVSYSLTLILIITLLQERLQIDTKVWEAT
jgi:ribonucleotide monophosphatase NagD (HAD superfamily)